MGNGQMVIVKSLQAPRIVDQLRIWCCQHTIAKARAKSLCDYVEKLQPQPSAVEAAKLISHEMDTIRILQEIMITLAPPPHNLWLVFKDLMETWSATRPALLSNA